MTTTRRNIAANVAGRIWGIASFYLFIPIYLRLLGAEAYGVVGFYMVMLGVLVIADLGLTSTLSREMARLGALDSARGDRRDLMLSLERLYLAITLVAGLGVVVLAPVIAERWLQARAIPRHEMIVVLRLMGIALALQMSGNFYFGGLLGLERLVAANSLQVGWAMLRAGASALALWLIAPTLMVFFVTAIITNLGYLVATRIACWRALGSPEGGSFRRDLLSQTWRYSAAMAGMTILSSFLSQLDKLVVSRLLPLDVFTHYSLASTLSQAPVIVGAAIATALFPRLTMLAAAGPPESLRRFYHAGSQLVAVVTFPLGLTLAAFAPEVLLFWTRSPATASTAGSAGSLLLVGSTVLAILLVPYQLALAYGRVGLNLCIGIAQLFVIAPALWVLVSRDGLVGAGWVWLGLNVSTGLIMIPLLHRRVMPGATRSWLLTDVARPLIATLAVLAVGRVLTPRVNSPTVAFLIALGTGGTALAAAAIVSPAGRTWLRLRRIGPSVS